MADSEPEPESGQGPSQNMLAQAIERVRNDQADRDDVVVEMKQAAHARLDLLANDLQPVFDALPEGHDQFEFGLTNGETPRLWIDLTTHVRMGREPRTYEFVKDTRNGRVLLGETAEREAMARQVADYVAERVLLRQRAIEGDWQERRSRPPKIEDSANSVPGPSTGGRAPGMFLLGLLAGAAAMVAWAWFGQPPQF